MIQTVTSRSNPKVKLAASLCTSSACRKKNRFIMEGPRFVRDSMAAGLSPDFVLLSSTATTESTITAEKADESGVTVVQLSETLFNRISGTDNPQGLLAVFPIPQCSVSELFSGKPVLLLDRVADPGNAGTAVRSAAAFGCGGVGFLKGSVFPWNPKVTRASAGLNALVRICELDTIAEITDELSDYTVLGAQSTGTPIDRILPSLEKPVCLVIGSEAHGLSPKSLSHMSAAVSIPMTRLVESLNAGVSASILLAALFRKRL